MIDYLHGPVAHEAFFKKYASKKFLKGRLIYLPTDAIVANLCNSINYLPQMGERYVCCSEQWWQPYNW